MENQQNRAGRDLVALSVVLGMPRWEAAGRAAEAGWLEELQPLWDSYARRVTRSGTLIRTLDQVAEGSRTVANRWLQTWLQGRRVPGSLVLACHDWAEGLPEGLDLEGDLMLSCSPLAALPGRLKVGGELWLDRSGIRALPEGLEVGGSLWLRRCRGWDGLIPPDARVRSRVFTDRHPRGLPLAEWRPRYPLGERPDLRGAR